MRVSGSTQQVRGVPGLYTKSVVSGGNTACETTQNSEKFLSINPAACLQNDRETDRFQEFVRYLIPPPRPRKRQY